MAFSWNPFKKKTETSEDGFYNPETVGNNNNYKIFKDVDEDIDRIISMRSAVDQHIENSTLQLSNPSFQTVDTDGTLILPVITNKVERLNQYRTISNFPECDWCLDEICDDFLHEDEFGNFINLTFNEINETLDDTRKDILLNEFNKYIEHFNLKENGFNLIRRFLIEGELCWENIIKHDIPDLGIIGIKFLPADYYDQLIDPKTSKSVGIYFDANKYAQETQNIFNQSYYGSSSQIFSTFATSGTTTGFNKNDCVIFLWPQITYINSGNTSSDGRNISYPLIEKAKQAYHQLALLQDAAVILRVTRAPERLLFNISTGKMTQNYADAYVRNFAQNLKSKKVPTKDANGNTPGGNIASVYNPVSMLESYIFGKSDGNDGTSVESVGSSASYDEIADIEYFLRRLMKQFKVPFTRYKTPENTMERDESISYEEYSFARMIVRLQRRFALGFKSGYITHLKLRGIWDKYKLTDNDLEVDFVTPVLYELYQTQKLVETKMNIYRSVIDNEEMSKIVAMKKYLGWTDADIETNFIALAKEKMLSENANYWGDKVGENGLGGVWAKPPVELGKGEEESDDSGDTTGDDKDSEPPSDAPSGQKEASEPSFGLG